MRAASTFPFVLGLAVAFALEPMIACVPCCLDAVLGSSRYAMCGKPFAPERNAGVRSNKQLLGRLEGLLLIPNAANDTAIAHPELAISIASLSLSTFAEVPAPPLVAALSFPHGVSS